jgi:hypothetical protein
MPLDDGYSTYQVVITRTEGHSAKVLTTWHSALPQELPNDGLEGLVGGGNIAPSGRGIHPAGSDLLSHQFLIQFLMISYSGKTGQWPGLPLDAESFGAGHVRVFDATPLVPLEPNAVIAETAFRGGVLVAAGDVSGDGHVEIVVHQSSDGRQYKPLLAFYVEDLDNRLNVDAHANASSHAKVVWYDGLGTRIVFDPTTDNDAGGSSVHLLDSTSTGQWSGIPLYEDWIGGSHVKVVDARFAWVGPGNLFTDTAFTGAVHAPRAM